MSAIPLDQVKSYLDVIHSLDDVKLQNILDASESEALEFMDRGSLLEWDDLDSNAVYSESGFPQSVWIGVMLLMQANYQASPDDAEKLRRAAEIKLMPFRRRFGV